MGGKLKIIVSDLHIGAGMFTKANLLEDFSADDEFAALLADIKVESDRDHREVEFIINGDFFEFLQVPAVDNFDPSDSYPPAAYTNSSAEASVRQLKTIAANHPHVFSALTDFMHVEAPVRRITVIKGNHDVNLYWPEAKACLRDILGATGVRASLLLFAEEFISRENIYVEHGHQRTEKVNRFPDFVQPVSPDDPQQLYYPPGSHFVINYFNQAEREIWWLDNIKPLTGLIWFTFKWDFTLAAKLLAGFLKHSPGLLAGSFALEEDDHQSFVDDLADESRRKIMAQRYAASPQYQQDIHRRVQQLLDAASLPDDAPHAFKADALPADPLDMARREQKKVQGALTRAAQSILSEGQAQVVLFGHTHAPAIERTDDGHTYINTGAWLWHQDLSHANDDTWADLFAHPEQYTQSRRLPYARIDYADNSHDTITQVELIDFSGQGFVWDTPPPSLFERFINWIMRLFGAG